MEPATAVSAISARQGKWELLVGIVWIVQKVLGRMSQVSPTAKNVLWLRALCPTPKPVQHGKRIASTLTALSVMFLV